MIEPPWPQHSYPPITPASLAPQSSRRGPLRPDRQEGLGRCHRLTLLVLPNWETSVNSIRSARSCATETALLRYLLRRESPFTSKVREQRPSKGFG
jgi:hypothetical protein